MSRQQIKELREKKEKLENDPDVRGNARIARIEQQIEELENQDQQTNIGTDKDLDGEKEEVPGARVGGTEEDFKSGKAEQQRQQVIAGQFQDQLETKKENIKESDKKLKQDGEKISEEQALSQVDQQIELAEQLEQQASENINIIEKNQEIKEENEEIRREQDVRDATIFLEGQKTLQKLEKELKEQERQENIRQQVTPTEKKLQDVEEAGFELVQTGERLSQDITQASRKTRGATSNIGDDFAALFEAGAGAQEVSREIQTFDTEEPVESLQQLSGTTKEEIVDPSLVAFTDADELGLVEPSKSLEQRTTEIQGTAATTPLDTAGFFTTVGAGGEQIIIEETVRTADDTAELVTGKDDVVRPERTGEGFERISAGTGILAKEVAENPGKIAQQEITQETAEAVFTAGVPTLTVTSTPTIGNTVEGTVNTIDSKIRGINQKTPGLKTRKGQVATTTSTESPTPNETVSIDQRLNDLEINPLNTDTLLGTQTTETTTTTAEPEIGAGTGTLAINQAGTDTVSEPSTISEGRPQTLTDTIDQTLSTGLGQTLTQTPSQTSSPSLTLTETVTETVSPTQTQTTTPTQTPTQTNTVTTTPTPDVENNFDSLETGIFEEDNDEEPEDENLPSLDALLTGTTGEISQEEVFTGLETRPLDEDIL